MNQQNRNNEQQRQPMVQISRTNRSTSVQNPQTFGRVGQTTGTTSRNNAILSNETGWNNRGLDPRGSIRSPSYSEFLADQAKTRRASRRECGEEIQADVNEKRKEVMGVIPHGSYFFKPIPKKMIEATQRDKPHDQRVNEFLYHMYGRNY